ncbi:class I SAM-dependent methyltransferase [Pirellulaceae bacterium SH449]
MTISVPDPDIDLLNDAPKLLQYVVDTTGLTPVEALRKLRMEFGRSGFLVSEELRRLNIPAYVWSDNLSDFYENTDAFLFESICWNRTATKKKMRLWIAEFLATQFTSPARIVVFGDGQGFDSFYLARAGHQVDYFEVSKKSSQFAKRMFDDYRAPVQMLSSIEQLEPAIYDVVVCLDVLEHVPEPAEVVRLLSNTLRPNGKLILHAPFWYLSPNVPTHLASNRRYSGDLRQLFYPLGLVPIDGAFFWNPIVLEKVGVANVREKSELPKVRNKSAIHLGGALLAAARYWSWPHTAFANFLNALGRESWEEMRDLESAQQEQPFLK